MQKGRSNQFVLAACDPMRLHVVLLLFFLAGCANGTAPATEGNPTSASATLTLNSIPAGTVIATNNPAMPLSTGFATPEGTPVQASMPVLQADQVKPQLGDALLARGGVYINSATVSASPDQQGTVLLSLKGVLPTPCHGLRAQAHLPDSNNRIAIEVYSVFDSNRMCAQVLVFFDLILPVSGLSTGREYAVTVNGQNQFQFQWPLP